MTACQSSPLGAGISRLCACRQISVLGVSDPSECSSLHPHALLLLASYTVMKNESMEERKNGRKREKNKLTHNHETRALFITLCFFVLCDHVDVLVLRTGCSIDG